MLITSMWLELFLTILMKGLSMYLKLVSKTILMKGLSMYLKLISKQIGNDQELRQSDLTSHP